MKNKKAIETRYAGPEELAHEKGQTNRSQKEDNQEYVSYRGTEVAVEFPPKYGFHLSHNSVE
jgi:hypothetical protein